MADHFLDDEAQELLGELGIELGICRQLPQPGDLPLLAARIGGGQAVLGLVGADRLGDAEALGEDVDQRGVDIVDAGAEAGEDGIGLIFAHRGAR